MRHVGKESALGNNAQDGVRIRSWRGQHPQENTARVVGILVRPAGQRAVLYSLRDRQAEVPPSAAAQNTVTQSGQSKE